MFEYLFQVKYLIISIIFKETNLSSASNIVCSKNGIPNTANISKL